MIESYPLFWPAGYTRSREIIRSRFKRTPGQSRDLLNAEIARLKAKDLIISTNIPTKQNGELYADWQRYKIDDHGVAVYFTYKEKQVCLCCDKYDRIFDNIYAIARTIEALRQIDRDGVSDFLDNAFTGFKALPENASAEVKKEWWQILQLEKKPDSFVKTTTAFHDLSKVFHPDKPTGSKEKFQEVNNAYQNAKKYFFNLSKQHH